MNAISHPARAEQSDELNLVTAHLAAMPAERLAALERAWVPVPYKIDPERRAMLERDWL